MTGIVSIRREAIISIAVNALLSAAFFLTLYGVQPRALHWSAPDRLALDFVPQSVAVALMSALVPALIVRRRFGYGPALRPILVRAAGLALAGAVLGGLLALTTDRDGATIDWTAALLIKIAYGGTLGALVATCALHRLLSHASIPEKRG